MKTAIDHAYLNQNPFNVYVESRTASSTHTTEEALYQGDIDYDAYLLNINAFHGNKNRWLFIDPDTGTQVAGYLLNPDSKPDGEETMTAIFPTYASSPSTNPGNQNEYAVIAASTPDRPMFVIDNPGVGGSDFLPREIYRATTQSGRRMRETDFLAAGLLINRALGTKNVVPTAYAGVSGGSYYGIGAAANGENGGVRQVMAFDMPLLPRRKLVAAGLREALHRNHARSASKDPYMDPWEEIVESDAKVASGGLGELIRRLHPQKLHYEPVTFGHGTRLMPGYIQAVLDNHAEIRVDLVQPEHSELASSPVIIPKLLGALSIGQNQEVRRITVPGATHISTATHPSAIASLFHYSLNT